MHRRREVVAFVDDPVDAAGGSVASSRMTSSRASWQNDSLSSGGLQDDPLFVRARVDAKPVDDVAARGLRSVLAYRPAGVDELYHLFDVGARAESVGV